MSIEDIREFLAAYPYIVIPVAIILAYLLFRVTRFILARVSFRIAFRTETTYDDLMVDALYPFRVAWLVPLILAYFLADFAYSELPIIKNMILFLILWLVVDFSISLLSGINEVYEHRPQYEGKPIAGYIGLLKVLAVTVGIVLSISIFADVPPAVLLGGVGAWLAVLLLIFRDTILAFLASVQISTQELVKDGDWIQVPSYDANGTVIDISLNSITVRNFDNTITIIPTYKIVDVAFKNWRGMQEAGGRRIVSSIQFDINTIRFCSLSMLEKLAKYDLITDIVGDQIRFIQKGQLEQANPPDFPLDGPQITNLQLYMRYVEAFLKSRKDLHQRRLAPVIQTAEPGSQGLAVQIFVFTKKTDWVTHAAIRDELVIHLVAAAPYFGLRIFQESTDIEFLSISER